MKLVQFQSPEGSVSFIRSIFEPVFSAKRTVLIVSKMEQLGCEFVPGDETQIEYKQSDTSTQRLFTVHFGKET